ncbi:MAG TPA: membrane protein insertion efficiency factor YidD [Rubrivivax sp.]|nr:membrane protein insertion efficiency factor YidD [Rubrivivax sp.]
MNRLWRRAGEALWHAPQRLLLLLVHGYRLLFKPWLGNACRFEPTCSAYALQALQQHGALAGATLSAGRLLRCHPWCDGGCDPVPSQPPKLFTRLGLSAGAPPSTSEQKKFR